jgi:hypothetical protein
MRYSEWNKLNDDEKKNAHWKKHPRIRVATIFSILFALVFGFALLRIFKNKRVHVNRQPNALEAFTVSKTIIKNKLQYPATTSFPTNKYQSLIDTATNSYQVSSTLNAQDSTGKIGKLNWKVQLTYTGGDWADPKSWRVNNITIAP